MLKRLLSLVLTTIIVLAFPVSVNAEEATELPNSADTYSSAEDDSATSIPNETETESEPVVETEPIIEQPSVAPIATELPTEDNEDSFDTVEIQSKPELASTGASGETYEQAARYVPNYVITGTDTIQTMYNPYTAQMAYDMSLAAYKISENDDWSDALIEYGYAQIFRVENSAVYGLNQETTIGNMTDQNWFSSLNATVGLKQINYNGKTKYAIAVAFRGTNLLFDPADIIDDLTAIPNSSGIHKGFSDNANNFYNISNKIIFNINGSNISLFDMIQDMRNDNSQYCMIVTGHSLGGATADVLVGYTLYNAGVKPTNIAAYTFAAPKSTGEYYSYPQRNIINIINEDDWVTTVGGAKRIGTDFFFTPDDDFRRANYGSHYIEGHGTAWWSSLVNQGLHFVSHGLNESYKPIVNHINNNTNDYTNYNTNGSNIWSSVKISDNCYQCINGNLTIKSSLIFDRGTLVVFGDCSIGNDSEGRLDMLSSTDHLLVYGNFTKNGVNRYYVTWPGGYYTYDRLTAGTVEIKGNFYAGDIDYCYYETNNHKTVFSGSEEQTISFARTSYNRFENPIFSNERIRLNSKIGSLKLSGNASFINTDAIETGTITLNGYSINTLGDIKASTINMNGGKIKANNVSAKTVIVEGDNNTVEGSLETSEKLEFKSSRLEVTGDCSIGNDSEGRFDMLSSADYLLVHGNFTKNGVNRYYVTWPGGYYTYDRLTAGTVEIKGNFYAGDIDYCYYETDNHITVFSGNEEQTISFARTSYNRFENPVFTNSNIVFATRISSIKLSEDTLIDSSNIINVSLIQLNGFSLTTSGDINAGTINSNGGNLSTNNLTTTSPLIFSGNSFSVHGDLSVPYIRMTNEKDVLFVDGNLSITSGDSSNCNLTNGIIYIGGDFSTSSKDYSYNASGNHTTVLNGTSLQTISFGSPSNYERFNELIIANNSNAGVAFESRISVGKLFDHKRNHFTLYNEGIGSTFVDYDGDGMKDNVDPYPTDPNNTPLVEKKRGDADGDGEVTILDATHIQRYLAAFDVPNFNEVTADADNDGSITILDATAIQRYLAAFENIHNIGEKIIE